MKKQTLNLVLLVASFWLLSCSKDSPAPASTLVSTPEAVASENTSSGGVYKGVFVGSSGTFKISLQNGKIEATLTLDGTTKTLTTSSLSGWTTGQAITNAVFTNGDWSVTFSVGADGTNPEVSITIPGHTIEALVAKELSTSLVMGFEGTYSGTESGIWNLVIQGSVVQGVARSSSGNISTATGVLSGNTITIGDATGTINGSAFSGTWYDSPSSNGTWKGNRTL